MRFKRIKLFNIRSYKSQEIIFPEGSLLLAGDVGSGKTTILMAIEYALFGLQPGQKGNALLRNNTNLGEVALELEIQGRDIVIERKLKRTPKGVSNEYAALTIDGTKYESSVTEIKSRIVSLLGYPPEFVKKNNILYRYTVHTAQEQMKQIILEDAETRVNILRHVFGIDKYRVIKNNLSLFVSSLKSDAKILQAEVNELERDNENLNTRKSDLLRLEESISLKKKELEERTRRRKSVEFEMQSIEKSLEERKNLEQEIEKTKILLATKREILLNLLREEDEAKQILANVASPFDEQIYAELIKNLKTKREELEELNSKNIELLGRLSFLENEREETLLKKERIFKIEICPTCLQDVAEHHKHNILNETETKLSSIRDSFNLLQEERKKISESLSKNKSSLSQIEDSRIKMEISRVRQEQIESAHKKIAEITKQKDAFARDQELLLAHAESLRDKIFQYSPLEAKYRSKELEFKQALIEERSIDISLAETIKELELSRREILLLEKEIWRKEETKGKLYHINELVDWLSNNFSRLIDITERNVLLRLRKEFSGLFRKWFLILVSDSTLDSQIDENFTPVILQRETEMDYSYLSGGERTAVALAYRLALNQTINSLMSRIKTRGVIILDEPTDGFSEAQIGKVRDILEELDAGQLIIVSHEQKIEGFVDNVIRVSKESDVSTIEETLTQRQLSQ